MYEGGSKCFEFSNPSLPFIILSTIRSGWAHNFFNNVIAANALLVTFPSLPE